MPSYLDMSMFSVRSLSETAANVSCRSALTNDAECVVQ
jgi:hypothetical protein